MIKLKNIIKEINNETTSWQNPVGDFIPTKLSHKYDAFNHIGRNDENSVKILWKQGWNRITSDAFTLFVHNEIQPPNDKQKTKLIELAIKFNLNEIVYVARSEWSGHREKIKVIWSKNDVL